MGISRIFIAAVLLAAIGAQAAGLPDTGQDTCYGAAAPDSVAASDPASIARDAGGFPRQDCRYGRDPAAAAGSLSKVGGGVKGFDYTKLAGDGSVLDASAAGWACVRDNVTGLTWEGKTWDSNDLHYKSHSFTWKNADSASNGGNTGSAGTNTCNGTLAGGQCNTEALVAAVNAVGLCGYTDWRVPSKRELLSLIDLGASGSLIDPGYFPNVNASPYWTASSYAANSADAWNVNFGGGDTNHQGKSTAYYVLLVRGGPF